MYALLRRFAANTPAAVVTIGLTAVPAALAQQPNVPSGDVIDQTRRLQSVAMQQLEADVRLGLSEASRMSDKSEAIAKYKALLGRVESENLLPADRRATLKRVLKDRIRIAETAAAVEKEKVDDAAPKVKTQFAEGAAAHAAPSPESADVKEGLANVAELKRQNKQAEAGRKAQELLQKYPDNVAVRVLNGESTLATNLDEASAIRVEKENRTVLAMRDMDRSSLPPIGDVEFPKDWKERSERRLRSIGLSPDERALLQTLEQPVQVEFKSSRLQDVMDYLSTRMNRTIIIDKNAMDENQVTYDSPITFNLRTPVSARTALRGILSNVNMTYVIRDGAIYVTNQARAKDLMVTRSYYIGDLVAGLGTFGGAVTFGAQIDQAQLAQNVQAIIEMIASSIDPTSWQGRGGLGNIGYNIPTQSLIIRQSAEVHNMIRSSLYKR